MTARSRARQELGNKLADANIGETMEYDEYLLLVKQLGKRPDKSVETRELKGAVAMVCKDKTYISTCARRVAAAAPLCCPSKTAITTECTAQTSTR